MQNPLYDVTDRIHEPSDAMYPCVECGEQTDAGDEFTHMAANDAGVVCWDCWKDYDPNRRNEASIREPFEY